MMTSMIEKGMGMMIMVHDDDDDDDHFDVCEGH